MCSQRAATGMAVGVTLHHRCVICKPPAACLARCSSLLPGTMQKSAQRPALNKTHHSASHASLVNHKTRHHTTVFIAQHSFPPAPSSSSPAPFAPPCGAPLLLPPFP